MYVSEIFSDIVVWEEKNISTLILGQLWWMDIVRWYYISLDGWYHGRKLLFQFRRWLNGTSVRWGGVGWDCPRPFFWTHPSGVLWIHACQSVRPSQKLWYFPPMDFSDFTYKVAGWWMEKSDEARFSKKKIPPILGQKGVKKGSKWGFCPFSRFDRSISLILHIMIDGHDV